MTMKLVRTLALGAALALSTTVAGAQSADSAKKPHAAAKARGDFGGKARRGGDRDARAMFRDVALTEAQKQQVKAIVDKYQPQRQALMKQVRDRREGGQRPDSAFLSSIRTQRQQLQERQVSEIRSLLTADQRAKFDTNVAAMKERDEKRAAKMKDGKGKGEGRRGGRAG
jgi:Spy/CpxP family protein refolding chaperone